MWGDKNGYQTRFSRKWYRKDLQLLQSEKRKHRQIRCKCQSSGTFPKSRQSHCRTRGYPFLLPGQRIHIPSEYDFQLLQYSRWFHPSGKRLQRIDLPSDPGACPEAHSDPWAYLFWILQRALLLRKYPGILPPSGKQWFRAGHSGSLPKAGAGLWFSHPLQSQQSDLLCHHPGRASQTYRFLCRKKYLRDDRRNLCGICPGYQRHHRSSADTGIHQSHGTPRRIQILRCSRNAPGLRHHRKYGLSCKNARKTDTMVT